MKSRPQILGRLLDDAASMRPVRECEIRPQRTQHLGEMGLARAVKPGNPNAPLVTATESGKVGFD
jgi:hypothetical protein